MSTRVLCETRKFHVETTQIVGRDGTPRERAVVRHPGAVVILPVRDDGGIVLIRNERFAVGEVLWELPAGTREPGEADDVGARRELAEETGYRAGRLEPLVRFYASPGICDEEMVCFVARDLTEGEQSLDPGERIEPVTVAPAEFREMLRDGRIRDGKTLAAGLYYFAFTSGGGGDGGAGEAP